MTGSRRTGLRLERPVSASAVPVSAVPVSAVPVSAVPVSATATRTPFGPIRFTDVRSLGGPVLDLDVPPGTELLREGLIVGTFFVIRSGAALLVRDECPLCTLSNGDCFGELDALAPEPQPYGVITTSATRLLAFSSFGIGRLCDALPGVRQRLREAIATAPDAPAVYGTSPTRSRSAAGSSTVTVR